jgi:hypothetical protein
VSPHSSPYFHLSVVSRQVHDGSLEIEIGRLEIKRQRTSRRVLG